VSSRTTSTDRRSQRAETPGHEGAKPALLVVTAVLAVVAVVGAVLLVGGGRDDSGTTGAAGAPFGMAHVHGLGLDDDQLVAGTHYGAFRVARDGTVSQVGPTQDLMGFAVVGPDHYLASGHPGAEQEAPGDLGLLESTDGGSTWEHRSLRGEADFHSLEARHDRVYGHSGGVLMVSEDGTTWDERSRIDLVDLAVSPDEPDTIVATTQQGLVVSTDGGEHFELVDGAPVLVLVTWTEQGTLVGVDPQGTVRVSDDGGSTWQERGSTGGQPAALTARSDEVFVATTDGRIVESSDGGQSFSVRYRES
jgi:hypothetical protein